MTYLVVDTSKIWSDALGEYFSQHPYLAGDICYGGLIVAGVALSAYVIFKDTIPGIRRTLRERREASNGRRKNKS